MQGTIDGRAVSRPRILIAAVAVLAAVLAPLTVVAVAPASARPDDESVIQRILDDTNSFRAENGLAPLTRNASIDSVAAAWSRQQASASAMSHNPSFSQQMPSGWSRAGENVAYGYDPSGTKNGRISVVDAWINSDGHRANLLGDYTDIGIGIAYAANGYAYYTQNFGKYARSAPVTQPGAFDSATSVFGGMRLQGWVVDKTAPSSPSTIRVTVDGTSRSFTADASLPWIASAYPGAGSSHGFDVMFPSGPGSHSVCVYGPKTLIGCKTVDQAAGAGALDSVTAVPGGIVVSGWTLKLTSASPSYAWINVDGSGAPVLANQDRQWIASYFPGAGSAHGYTTTIPANEGWHQVCAYGESLLGCRSVYVGPVIVGSVDSVTSEKGALRIRGWATDLHSVDPAWVWVTVNGVGQSHRADRPVAWMEALYPGKGSNHGFDITLPASSGSKQVCLYIGATWLGCRTGSNTMSAGAFDSISGGSSSITASGWSVDLRSTDPSYIWVNVDGRGSAQRADRTLPWIEALFPDAGDDHGFQVTLPASRGSHSVCVYGSEALLDCKQVWVGP